MDEQRSRNTSNASSDVYSPILLRRRLSAPETIMRKHMLAQQRSDSQESDVTQVSGTRSCQWRCENVGSDPNLSKKRDAGLMRKSTLLRRMWSNSKPVLERTSRFSNAYFEWQHSFGKLSSEKSTHSLGSNHSSPEHLRTSQSKRSLNGEDFRTSPKHSFKQSPKNGKKNGVSSPNHRSVPSTRADDTKSFYSTCCSNCGNVTSIESSRPPVSSSDTRISSTPKTETDSENYSTRSTGTSLPVTLTDNSDSAYTNSCSNFSSNGISRSTLHSSELQKYIDEEPEEFNEDANQKFQNVANNNLKPDNTKASNEINETSTQTNETTNLNVISNVQLSQSTLDLIFSQVMQDVQNNTAVGGININTMTTSIPVEESKPKLVTVKQVPSFYLKRKEEININPEHNRIVKYMISNVGTGSPYSKPAEVPQVVVPRFSALPRTSSMEVNTSSGESTDKESDTISLVDSLEDPSSPRIDSHQINRHDNKPVRGDLSVLLPDNSSKKKKKQNNNPTSFFIPIEKNSETDTKSVSELLPEKVREKLTRRQLKREQKLQQSKFKTSPRSDSNYISASENGNHINYTLDNSSEYNLNSAPNILPDVNYNRPKKRSKPLLPSIESIRKKVDNTRNFDREKRDNKFKQFKRKSTPRENPVENPKSKQNHSRGRQRLPEKLSPLYTTRNEYVYDAGPRRIYHKTELSNSNKRIEILEIMECVEANHEKYSNTFQKGKSKIPILVNPKLPKIASDRKSDKPSYLDFEDVALNDQKIDQLIANILIDTLNKGDMNFVTSKQESSNMNEKRPQNQQPQAKFGHKYHQRFAVIPEELSQQSSAEDHAVDNNVSKEESSIDNADDKKGSQYKGKAAIAVVKDDDFSTIPKGWITFYMLHKSQGSPDSTSDEGTKNPTEDIKKQDQTNNNDNERTNDARLKSVFSECKEKSSPESGDNFTSSDTDKNCNVYPPLPPPNRFKRQNSQKRGRYHSANGNQYNGQWSVTVSGTNASGNCAPDLEMRLRFPQNGNGQSQSDSGLGNETLENLQPQKSLNNGVSSFTQTLPDIRKSRRVVKRSDSGIPLTSLIPAKIEPRQTRTSTRRFSLNRPKAQLPLPNDDLTAEESHFAEVLRRLPHILTITGNAISPERKPRVPTMTERDLTRNIYANQ